MWPSGQKRGGTPKPTVVKTVKTKYKLDTCNQAQPLHSSEQKEKKILSVRKEIQLGKGEWRHETSHRCMPDLGC